MDTNLRAVRLLKGGVHMKKTTRRKYTDEFKDEAVKLVADQGYRITEATGNLDIFPLNLLCKVMQEATAG